MTPYKYTGYFNKEAENQGTPIKVTGILKPKEQVMFGSLKR